MHGKFLLFTGVVLLVVFCSFTCSAEDTAEEDDNSTTSTTTETSSTTEKSSSTTKKSTSTTTDSSKTSTTKDPSKTSTKGTKKTTKKRKSNYGSSGYGSKYNNKGKGDDDSYEVVGQDGNDPSKDGTDYGDFGPVYDNKKSMLSQLDVWISGADDWKKNDKDSKGDSDGDDNDDPKGYRKKRSYKKVRFPVKRVKNYRKFPIRRFPPLISIFPWVPIFYDKLTYQTIIFSPTGGLYIIPPLINFFGQRFAVAQLIKWGYASLVSSGAPVGPGVDVAPLVQPAPAGGPAPGGPAFDSSKSRFTGGVKTDFRDFKPRYSQTIEEGGESDYKPARSNYGTETSYGGSRNQQVVAQGGPQYPRGY
jgi:hypothetical protein